MDIFPISLAICCMLARTLRMEMITEEKTQRHVTGVIRVTRGIDQGRVRLDFSVGATGGNWGVFSQLTPPTSMA